jgi:hypothetical protein
MLFDVSVVHTNEKSVNFTEITVVSDDRVFFKLHLHQFLYLSVEEKMRQLKPSSAKQSEVEKKEEEKMEEKMDEDEEDDQEMEQVEQSLERKERDQEEVEEKDEEGNEENEGKK